MSQVKAKASHSSKGFDEVLKVLSFLGGISIRGAAELFIRFRSLYFIAFLWSWISFLLVFWNYKHLKWLHLFFPNVFTPTVVEILVEEMPLPILIHTLILILGPIAFFGFLFGIVTKDKKKEISQALAHLGLKTAQGREPLVSKVVNLDEYRQRVLVSSIGIGVERYLEKKSDLEMALGATVESIRTTANNKFVEILTTTKIIPSMVPYLDVVQSINEPLSFPIGESLAGIQIQYLSSLPHMMIAGASGGGKSNFFKQTLLSLIKSTKNIQVYILDLKKGIEAKEFSCLPNVSIAKTEIEANLLLAKLRQEMISRFDLLEKNGRTSIDPERDKKDYIVIAVDEASVLYGKTKVSKERAKNVTQARELTDDLAKLGRAAKMNLIIATQKVTTDTIDTKIQENMGGRICFRANTLQGSLTVLGNKMAFELPDVKGRAVWANGTTFTEVQTPFVKEDVLKDEINKIKIEYEAGVRSNFSLPFRAIVEATNEAEPTLGIK
tara:strand:- start:13187 stop:14674 length:1488 start_codon:yes stop_codon:yes gene_type:complete